MGGQTAPSFMEPEPLLMTLRNLMRAAWEREQGIAPTKAAAKGAVTRERRVQKNPMDICDIGECYGRLFLRTVQGDEI